MTTTSAESTALVNLENLEDRLRRVEFLLSGTTDFTGSPTSTAKPTSHDETVSARLGVLEQQLNRLKTQNVPVQEVLQLRKPSTLLDSPVRPRKVI